MRAFARGFSPSAMVHAPPTSRAAETAPVDLLVVGGGINGAGIARDAAGRGLSVVLAEMGDLASATSSASSKLIHGGLRYLEHGALRLVREALTEREVLLRAAPHIIWPLRFVLPHDPAMRPAWMIRLGLRLYDGLGARRVLPGAERLDLARHPAGAPLRPHVRVGFAYSDCWVDDARLVALCAVDAAARGAAVLTRTRLDALEPAGGLWRARLTDLASGRTLTLDARAVANAAGPWVGRVAALRPGEGPRPRLVKGSHIVVPRLFEHDFAYILQNIDRRIVFALPFERRFTLIGTTDVEHAGPPGPVAASEEEVAYLVAAVGRWLTRPVRPEDVVHRFAGLRALADGGGSAASAASRDYRLVLDGGRRGGGPPLLHVVGGKITTFRRLAEQAVDRLAVELGRSTTPWTATATLPGGDVPGDGFDAWLADLRRRFPARDPALVERLARRYGTHAEPLLADPGEEIAAGIHAAELEHLARCEWARTAEDVLWRRTKQGLATGPEAAARIDARLATLV